jgi:glycosyltransferase involved in cell wall biosynthesis
MEDKISVIVPIYKVEKYLNRCVDSIINQTYRNLEIILVDDGSPDNSGRISDEYARTDSRVRVIHKSNGGLSDARNAGIEIATGEYIGFVDSDDFIHPEMFRDLHEQIQKHDADIAQCSFRPVTDDTFIDPGGAGNEKVISNLDALRLIYTQYKVDYIVAWDKLYRKHLFNSIRFPVSKIHEDEFTTYKLFYLSGKIVVIDKKYYYYYQSPNSIIRSGFNLKKLHYTEAMEERILFFKEKGLTDFFSLAARKYAQWILLFLYLNNKAIKNLPEVKKDLDSRYAAVEKLVREDPTVMKRLKAVLRFAPLVNPFIGFLIYQKQFKNNMLGRSSGLLGLD